MAQGTQPFVGPLAPPEMVSSRPQLGVLINLRFRDPGHFKAGMIHESFLVWQRLLDDYSCAVDLLEILQDGYEESKNNTVQYLVKKFVA